MLFLEAVFAYARGRQQITTKTKEGLVKDEGKWIDVVKKIDDQWKITVTIVEVV